MMRKNKMIRRTSMLLLILLLLSPIFSLGDVMDTRADNDVKLTVHYQKKNQDYEGWNLWLWPKGGQGEQVDFTGEDDFGKTLEVTKSRDSGSFGFIVRKGNWNEKDVDMDRFIPLSKAQDGVLELYLLEKDATLYYTLEEVDLSHNKQDQSEPVCTYDASP